MVVELLDQDPTATGTHEVVADPHKLLSHLSYLVGVGTRLSVVHLLVATTHPSEAEANLPTLETDLIRIKIP